MQNIDSHTVSRGTQCLPITYKDISHARAKELFPWDRQWLSDARQFYNELIRRQQAVQEPCWICGTDKNCYAHFPNPARALDVVWICKGCVDKFKNKVLPVEKLISILTPEMLSVWEKRKGKRFYFLTVLRQHADY